MNAFLECKIKDLPCAKHFVFTRFGIGVFDPKWLEYRIKLFSAVTLPSVVAQKNIDFVWVVFVDVDIDKESLQFLERCVGGYNFIYIVKVDFYADYFDISECLVGLSIDRNGSCLVSKIDDDAWHKDTFAELYNELDDYYSVYVFPTGYDFLCQERIILKKNRPYITHNTHFCFKRKDSLPILRAGHHRVAELSENYSLHVKEISTNKSMWLYSRPESVKPAPTLSLSPPASTF
ncbi:glycosyltransferase [Halomonas sp. KM007]